MNEEYDKHSTCTLTHEKILFAAFQSSCREGTAQSDTLLIRTVPILIKY
jgi:hypothetical protein